MCKITLYPKMQHNEVNIEHIVANSGVVGATPTQYICIIIKFKHLN
ncbi:MAG: hypothetical protein ACJAXB_001133 [Candidatus Endobugula sp.]|jgi:hypothetical protein